MRSFEFHNPTRILFGRGVTEKCGDVVSGIGRKALLVTGGGSVKRSGYYDRVKRTLEAADVAVIDLQGVKSNPVLSKVVEGISLAKEGEVDVVVALGGGSVMDTGKAVAAGALMDDGYVWQVFEGKRTIQKALPVVTIPSLAASGSEMNGYMVITNESSGYKLATGSPHLYPRVSLLDPEITFTVPSDYTAYGGVDAVCHLMEPYFNGPDPVTPVSDRIAEGLMISIMEATEQAISAPLDFEARAALMWGATLALNGLTKAGVGEHHFPVHMIEHSVSALFDVPHGAGLAALLPGWLRWYASEVGPAKVIQFGNRVFQAGGEGEEGVGRAMNALEAWLRKIGAPASLSELGIGREDLDRIADNSQFQAGVWGLKEELSRGRVMSVLEAAF